MTAPSNNDFRIAGALGIEDPARAGQEYLTQGVGFPLRPISGVPLTSTPKIPDGVIAEGIPQQWMGAWEEGKYYPAGAEVNDSGFLCVCVVPLTLDKPAPVNDGAATYSIPSYTPVEQDYTGFVRSGNVYTFTQGGWIQELRVWLPVIAANVTYQVIVVSTTPEGIVQTATFSNFVGLEDGWATVGAFNTIVPVNTKVEIYLDALNSGASSQFTGGWNYQGVVNTGAPTSQSWNKNQQNTVVRVNDVDLDSTDRSTELVGVIPNSTITITDTVNPNNFEIYRVNTTTDFGTYVEYAVTLLDAEGFIGVNDITRLDFDVPIPQPTVYAEQASYWPSNQPSWGTARGALAFDGAVQVVDDNAYGVDILFQPATVSSDWDIKSVP